MTVGKVFMQNQAKHTKNLLDKLNDSKFLSFASKTLLQKSISDSPILNQCSAT